MSEDIDTEDLARRLVIGRKRDGRSIYDAGAKRELIEACMRPGVSVTGLARACGVNANQLSTWVREHERGKAKAARRREVIEMPPAAFVPVQMEAVRSEPTMPSLNVQARLPNGVVLDLGGCDLQQAGQLIEALGRMRCSASTKG